MTSPIRSLQLSTRRCARVMLCAGTIVLCAHPASAGLTGAPRLAAIYDAILAARFDDAEQMIAGACPPAPPEACTTLRLVSAWWRIVLDPNSRAGDDRLDRAAAVAIRDAERWVARAPRTAEAWFYLAGAHAPRVQWQVLRGERLAAARDGRRIKDALERALALDGSLHDAHFGIGLYRYYADVAPAALKVLRWLFLLPGGNRAEGLQQMLQTREHGELLRGEADFQLHWIFLWYERNPERAVALLRGLDERYPSNPVFQQRIAEVQADYFHDHAASAAAWQTILDRAARDVISERPLAETRARLGLADALIATAEPERALQTLAPVLTATRDEVHSARATAHAIAGDAHYRRGDRARARDEYRAAIAAAPEGDAAGARARARTALGRNF